MSIESVMPSNHLIFCWPLLLLPSIFPSIRVFSSQLVLCIRWPKYWIFSFSISPSNEYSGLISFWTNGFDLLVVQGNLKSLLQYHNSKTAIQFSTFFMVQLSYLYMAHGKTTVSVNICSGLLKTYFIKLREFPPVPSFLEKIYLFTWSRYLCLIRNDCWIVLNAFSASFEMIFILSSANVMIILIHLLRHLYILG